MNQNLVVLFASCVVALVPCSAQTGNFTDLNVGGTAVIGSTTSRPITLWQNLGNIYIQGDSGGWAFGLHAKGFQGTPQAGFGFLGSADTLNYLYIGDSYANPTMIVQPNAGSVGIGTTNPSYKLHTYTSSNPIIEIAAQTDYSSAVSFGRASLSTRAVGAVGAMTTWGSNSSARPSETWVQTVTATPLVFGTADRECMRIDSAGNVGIGSTAPAAHFSLGGAAGIKQLVYDGNANYNAGLGTDLIGGMNSLDIFAGFGSGSDTAINFVMPTGAWPFPGYSAKMTILTSGNVGIGTTSPTEKLSVNGKIRAKEVIVETTGWSDYVFGDNYQLQPLSVVEQHIKADKHLPGVPSAQEVAEKGVSVGDMQAILLAKIEELTLHQIAQEKELAAQRSQIQAQAVEIASLKAENAGFKTQTK